MANTSPHPRDAHLLTRTTDAAVELSLAVARLGADPALDARGRIGRAVELLRDALRCESVELWTCAADGGFASFDGTGAAIASDEASKWRSRLVARRSSLGLRRGATPPLEAGVLGADRLLGALRCTRRRGSSPWNAADHTLLVSGADRIALLLEAETRAPRTLELDRVVQGFAHDLGNTLTTALGHVQMIAEGGPTAETSDSARDAFAALDFACQLAHQLRGFVAGQPTALAPLALSDVVHGVDRLLHAVVGRERKLTFSLDDRDVRLRGDVSALTRLLLNLVANARDATRRDGVIRVETRCDGDAVVLAVVDDGEGIAPGLLPRVFEHGFSTRREHGGTGLGLAAVRAIADAHGGAIHVESVPGAGTAVRVRFPHAR